MVTKAQVSKRLIDWHTSHRDTSPFGGIIDIHRSVNKYGSFDIIDGNGRFHPGAKELSKLDKEYTQKANRIAQTIKSVQKI